MLHTTDCKCCTQLIANAAQLIANAAQLIVNAAQLIVNTAQLIANAAQLIANAAQLIVNAAQLIGLQGYMFFPFFDSKHSLWVLVKTTSARRF